MLPYNPISPPGPSQTQGAAAAAFPAGSSRPSVAPGPKDYGASAIALRSPNSPAGTGRTALPPLASLANGPGPYDGPAPPLSNPSPSRLLPHREHHHQHHREREHREPQYQPYAPLSPQLPPQQVLQQLHHQTKNCRAQTLTPLGGRLRLSSLLKGPAAVPHLPRHHCSSNCIRRLRLLTCGVRGRCRRRRPTPSAFHCPLLPFLGQQRSGVLSVRSENGSSPTGVLPVALDGV